MAKLDRIWVVNYYVRLNQSSYFSYLLILSLFSHGIVDNIASFVNKKGAKIRIKLTLKKQGVFLQLS